MVHTSELTRTLDRPDVPCFLNNTNRARITPRIRADAARILFRQIAAARARLYTLRHGLERTSEPPDLFRRPLEQEIRETKRCLASYAGQFGKLAGQVIDYCHVPFRFPPLAT